MHGHILFPKTVNKTTMATTEKKRGPKDRSYVNDSEKHEVKYESKRKTPAKQFGGKKS